MEYRKYMEYIKYMECKYIFTSRDVLLHTGAAVKSSAFVLVL